MTYPVDDKGNPRVDFVWGNMAMQPDDQRDTVTSGPEVLIPGNIEGNRNWDATYKYPSEGLYASITQQLSVGDQSVNVDWHNPTTRTVPVPADNHSVALTGYQNYPAYIPNYAGDGDTGLEAKVPNVVTKTAAKAGDDIEAAGLVYASVTSTVGATLDNEGEVKSQSPAANSFVNAGSTVTVTLFLAPTVPNLVNLANPGAAQAALETAGLVLGDTDGSTDGATALNNLKVKSQSIPAGTKVNGGTVVDIEVFNYVAPTTTTTAPINYNIAGIRGNGLPNFQRYLYLRGRNSGLSAGAQITLANTGVANYNRPFDVLAVVDDDAFNTGGQKLTITNGLMTADGGDVTDTGTYSVDHF